MNTKLKLLKICTESQKLLKVAGHNLFWPRSEAIKSTKGLQWNNKTKGKTSLQKEQ